MVININKLLINDVIDEQIQLLMAHSNAIKAVSEVRPLWNDNIASHFIISYS